MYFTPVYEVIESKSNRRRDDKEKQYRDELRLYYEELGYRCDVEIVCSVGKVDLLAVAEGLPTLLVEAKEVSQWKHALGQILSYALFLDELKLIPSGNRDVELQVYLFQNPIESKKTKKPRKAQKNLKETLDYAVIGSVLSRYNVTLLTREELFLC
jgi:hypothetical protein